MLLYNLRFGWWNVALSPSAPQAKSKANATTYPIICTHIETLLQDNSCDFLALCEVSSEDIRYFSENIKLEHISILNLTDKIGKTRFDLAVIYKTSKIKVNHINSLSKILTDNTVKASQLVEVENIDDSRKIYIYLCHWPSRLNGNSEEKRIAAANIVYNSASTLIESGKDVMIMGDFNDNPYDISLYKCLKASRCHDAVKKYPSEYFYNPFWRSIVSENKYSHSGITNTYRSGSYKYKQFMGEIWHSYDQIIVSGSFINNTYWHLNEFRTQVITPEVILKNYEDNSHFIDHLPIVCEITRV